MQVVIRRVSNGYMVEYYSGLTQDPKDNETEVFVELPSAIKAAEQYFAGMLK